MESNRGDNESRLAELRHVLVLLEEARSHAENLGSPENRLLQAALGGALREAAREMEELLRSSPAGGRPRAGS